MTADVGRLLEQFCAKKSVKFSDFVATWKELDFYLIYWPGTDRLQKAEVIEQLLWTGVTCMCEVGGSSEIHHRVAGLYLAYAVYYTQPEPKLMVRVTTRQWETVKQLHLQMKKDKILDADYIFCRLKASSAFVLCAFPRPMCLSTYAAEQLTPQLEKYNMLPDRKGMEAFLEEVEAVTEDYDQQKKEMAFFLPQHLLNFPVLTDQMKACLENLDTVT